MGLGMGEIVLILVIALVVFGPRKLPELGKSLGQAMSQFRRASEDFKRTWEQEVDIEKDRKTGSTSSETNHSYNEPYDPYNSYTDESHSSGDSGTSQNGDSNSAHHNNSDHATAAVGAESTATKAQPQTQTEQKHWI